MDETEPGGTARANLGDELEGTPMDPVVPLAAGATKLAKTTGKMVSRMLGPPFDAYGKDLVEWHDRRKTNANRILESAEQMLGDRLDGKGSVYPRVLRDVRGEGSYVDNSLSAGYFGGVVASTYSGINRDDRGVSIAKMLRQSNVRLANGVPHDDQGGGKCRFPTFLKQRSRMMIDDTAYGAGTIWSPPDDRIHDSLLRELHPGYWLNGACCFCRPPP
jgi:hypothetical protein